MSDVKNLFTLQKVLLALVIYQVYINYKQYRIAHREHEMLLNGVRSI